MIVDSLGENGANIVFKPPEYKAKAGLFEAATVLVFTGTEGSPDGNVAEISWFTNLQSKMAEVHINVGGHKLAYLVKVPAPV